MSGHIALIGDSIFDNASYVAEGPSVIGHLQRIIPQTWQASLLAVDGATVTATFDQLERIPSDVSHIILSVGGNNALWTAGNMFSLDCETVAEAMEMLSTARKEFRDEYAQLIQELRSLELSMVSCTVYDSVPDLTEAELSGLTLFNDVITRTAFQFGFPLIDLRNICNEPSDYSAVSPIEPSIAGGGKIARAIHSAIFSATAGSKVISNAI